MTIAIIYNLLIKNIPSLVDISGILKGHHGKSNQLANDVGYEKEKLHSNNNKIITRSNKKCSQMFGSKKIELLYIYIKIYLDITHEPKENPQKS